MESIIIKKYELEEVLPVIIKERKNTGGVDVLAVLSNSEDVERMFKEDFETDILKNVKEEKLITLVKRYQSIVSRLKCTYEYKCQICGQTFLMDNGDYYCEAHHIVPISEDGAQTSDNVIILCANHHRMFHYAKKQIKIGEIVNRKRIIVIDGEEYEVEYNL